jgi:hypothetical protein
MHQERDYGIRFIRARKNHRCYGMGLGIMILDDVYPGFPGDVRNASEYPFPIQYELARGVDIHQLVVEEVKSPSCANRWGGIRRTRPSRRRRTRRTRRGVPSAPRRGANRAGKRDTQGMGGSSFRSNRCSA